MGEINSRIALMAEGDRKPTADDPRLAPSLASIMTLRNACFILAATLVVGATTGCSGGKEASVSGRVTLDSQPVQIGDVAFEPQAGGMMAHAVIDSDGNYELRTNQQHGLDPGMYRVKVISREKTPIPPGGGLPPPGKLLIPEKYVRVATSGLMFEVVPGNNRIDLELRSK